MTRAPATNTALSPATVITGAASGIGRELARLAADEGRSLLLIDRSGPPLEKLSAECSARGVNAAAICLDLTRPNTIQAIEDQLTERGWYCEVLVNNAGFGLFGPAAHLPVAGQLAVVDLNIRVLTELSLHFLPAMLERNSGGIIHVGSVAGYVWGPDMAVYFASKAYVNSFSMALAAEVAGSRVTITCLVPGVVNSRFFDRFPAALRTWPFTFMPRATSAGTAAVGWRGFRAGKRIVIAGWTNRLVVMICRLIPQTMLLRFIAAMR